MNARHYSSKFLAVGVGSLEWIIQYSRRGSQLYRKANKGVIGFIGKVDV